MWVKGEIGDHYSYSNLCNGSVSFRTNGLCGGDAGHGGFLEISIDTEKSTALKVSVDGYDHGFIEKLTLTYCGDDEIYQAIDSLEFLATRLRALALSQRPREG